MASRFLFLVFWSVGLADFESNKEIKSAHAMKLIKLITLRSDDQNPRDMKFR